MCVNQKIIHAIMQLAITRPLCPILFPGTVFFSVEKAVFYLALLLEQKISLLSSEKNCFHILIVKNTNCIWSTIMVK